MIAKPRALILSLAMIAGLMAVKVNAQQVADTDFKPPIEKPAYPAGGGPFVMIDEAHFNFHTATGRYLPFAELLRRDGYVVQASKAAFSRESLKAGKILVIANALNERNQGDWSLPTPSAFTDEEIATVRDWVNDGGALFLIADHMPFPGAAEKLAAAFGIRFNNGYAIDEKADGGAMIFRRSDGSLADHLITNGRSKTERIDSVATFTGSAFQVDKGAQPLFILGPSVVSLMPKVAAKFDSGTPRVEVKGWLQGAVIRYGKGRIAVFGEAAMFSAQLAGPNRVPMGMNSPVASQNPQFLLNVLRWLSGLFD